MRCGGGHRAALRPDMEKAPCRSLCAALFRWGEKKMEKEKERMHKTLGGGAVTRRRSWGEADYFVLSLARSKVTVSFSVSPLRETVSVALSPAE